MAVLPGGLEARKGLSGTLRWALDDEQEVCRQRSEKEAVGGHGEARRHERGRQEGAENEAAESTGGRKEGLLRHAPELHTSGPWE